jgi:putative phosphoesterase
MRVLIISDVHANLWALRAVVHDAGAVDCVLCAGDIVSYGPDPRATLDTLRAQGAIAVRGNHDHAVATGADPKASPAKQPLALAMRDWTRSQLQPADIAWLARLPLRLTWELAGTRFTVVHATPRDPLYDYHLRPDASAEFIGELTAGIDADVLVVGHTHWPLARAHGSLQVVNPGAVGQPLDGDPRAAYALWEDGKITLRRAEYDQMPVLAALGRLPLEPPLRQGLASMLRLARLD